MKYTAPYAPALALLLSFSLTAQQQAPPPAQPPGGTVKFSTTSQLVVEVVSVKDKNGNPIEGLTAKDFVVTENGTPQTISFCEFQKLQEATPAAAAPAPAAAPPITTPAPAPPPKADPTLQKEI